MDRLSCGLEVKFAAGAPEGTFSGYGSVFGNEDLGGDLIVKGAFADTLKEWKARGKMPKMLLQHGGFWSGVEDMIPIGQWTSMEEDSKGLAVEGRLIALDTDVGKRIYAAMKAGELDGLSIGYRAKEFVIGTKPAEPFRTIKRLDLKEVSVVLFGMNERATIDAVKSADIDRITTLSEAEEFLREAGRPFSRKTATEFVSVVKRIAQREAGAGKAMGDLLDQIRSVKALTLPTQS